MLARAQLLAESKPLHALRLYIQNIDLIRERLWVSQGRHRSFHERRGRR
jgi:hypothetical protein